MGIYSQHCPIQLKADTGLFDINYMISMFPRVTAEIGAVWMDLVHVMHASPTFSNLKTRYNRSDSYHTICLERYLGN